MIQDPNLRAAWLRQAHERGHAARGARWAHYATEDDLPGEPPAPLSGEWAGESIPELARECGIDPDDLDTDDLDAYEDAYYAAYEGRCGV